MANPDPNGYLMRTAENRAGREEAGVMSIAQLLKGSNNNDKKELPAGKEKQKEAVEEKPEDQG